MTYQNMQLKFQFMMDASDDAHIEACISAQIHE